jgi:hypothetical protein
MATTSYALRADGGSRDGVRHGCIVVPSSAERNGGEVRLAVRTPVGSESPLRITVDRGSGSDADCDDFEPSELVYRGTTDTLARRYPWDVGLAVADADDGVLTIRVGIEPIDAGTGGAGGTTWLDVEHRLTPDR